MADSTSASQNISREEAAAELETIASVLRGGEETIDIKINNKSVSLTPRETLDYDIEVRERSPMLRGKRESITIGLKWNVKK